MPRWVVSIAILMCVVSVHDAAAVKIPDVHHCTFPRTPPDCDVPGQCEYGFVRIVGMQAAAPGVPDPAGSFTVEMRDFANNPLRGCHVVFDLSECQGIRLCSAVVNGQTVNCASRQVSGFTDEQARLTVTLVGAGTGDAASGSCTGCIQMYGDGVWLTRFTPTVHDLDGAAGQDGVTASDLAKLARALAAASGMPILAAGDVARCDYRPDGVVNARDLGAYRSVLAAAGLGIGSNGCRDAAGAHPYCP